MQKVGGREQRDELGGGADHRGDQTEVQLAQRGLRRDARCCKDNFASASSQIFFADQMTRIEFEADLLKDEKVEREEEVKKPQVFRD